MATNKKSFLLYCDILHTVKNLSDEEAGRLFKHTLEYVNDLNPTPSDRLTEIVFEPIKQTFKRDLKKWEKKSERNKEIAVNAWEKRKHANVSERIPTHEVVPIESEKKEVVVHKSLIDFFFTDFPNSGELERVSMVLSVSKENLLKLLPEFKKVAALQYPNMMKFAEHFKNWYLKRSKDVVVSNHSKIKKAGR